MSLKAKLEAVIYAAEEPVTLLQLLQMFVPEALEHRADRLGQRIDGGEASLAFAPEPAEPAALPEEPAGATAEQSASDDAPPPDEEAGELRLTRLRERQAREELRLLLTELTEEYASEARGLELREVAGGFRFATKPLYHDAVRSLVRSLKPPLKLSLPALETLAVIAYKQPITSPEVSDVRGVDSAGVLGSLIARKLVTTAGRKAVIGRPILYKTTREFLLRFGLKDLNELPSMEEFEKMAATELEEEEPTAQGDLPLAAEDRTPATDAAAVEAAPELAQAPSDAEAADHAAAEITVDREDEPTQTAPDLPGVTRDSHGQIAMESSPASPVRRSADEDDGGQAPDHA